MLRVSEDRRRAAGVHEHHDLVRPKGAGADVLDHRGGAFAGIDRIQHHAFMAREQPDRLVAGLARHAVALAHELAEVQDLVGLDAEVEAERFGGAVGDLGGAERNLVLGGVSIVHSM